MKRFYLLIALLFSLPLSANDTTPPFARLMEFNGALDGDNIEMRAIQSLVLVLGDDTDKSPIVQSVTYRVNDESEDYEKSLQVEPHPFFKNHYFLTGMPLDFDASVIHFNIMASDKYRNKSHTYKSLRVRQAPLVDIGNGELVPLAISLNDPTTITIPLRSKEKEPLTGRHIVRAYLSPNAANPITVNGQDVFPSESIFIDSNFNIDESPDLKVQLATSEPSDEMGSLFITLDHPKAPIFIANLYAWHPKIKAENTRAAAFERMSIRISDDNSGCLFVDQAPGKDFSTPAGKKLCKVTVKGNDHLKVIPIDEPSEHVLIQGYFDTPSEYAVNVAVSVYSPVINDFEEAINTGFIVNVSNNTPPLAFAVPEFYSTTTLDGLNIPVQAKGCEMFTSQQDAMSHNLKRKHTELPACFISLSLSSGASLEVDRAPSGTTMAVKTKPLPIGTDMVSWAVKYIPLNGQPVAIESGTTSIRVTAPVNPIVTFEPANNSYPLALTESLFGEISIESSISDVELLVIVDGEEIQRRVIEKDAHAGLIELSLDIPSAPVGVQKNYIIRARYKALATLFDEVQVEALRMPESRVYAEIALDKTFMTVGESVSSEVLLKVTNDEYDPTRHGRWQVRLYRESSDNVRQYISQWLDIDDKGRARSEGVVDAKGNQTIRLGAELRFENNQAMAVKQTFSKSVFLDIYDPNDVATDYISSSGVVGPAPFTPNLSINPGKYVGGIEWMVRNQKEDKEFKVVSLGYVNNNTLEHDFPPGLYDVKARYTHLVTGEVFTMDPITVESKKIPNIKVEVQDHIFVNDTANIVATPYYGDNPTSADNIHFQWSNDGVNWIDGRSAYSITSESPAVRPVFMRARYKDAPEFHEAEHFAYEHNINFYPVTAPSIEIDGPTFMTAGEMGTWRATVKTGNIPLSYQLVGEFKLPNGEIQEGFEVKYKPTNEDVIKYNQSVPIIFKGYLAGHQETAQEVKIATRVQKYDWPEWVIATESEHLYAPTELKLTARPTRQTSNSLRGVRYRWSIDADPKEVAFVGDITKENVGLKVMKAGIYQLAVEVSDDLGNFSTDKSEVIVDLPDPLKLEVILSTADKKHRAPLPIIIRGYFTGGHPDDDIASSSVLINSMEVKDMRGIVSTTLEKAGQYVIDVNIMTKMGHKLSGVESILVNENAQPICELSAKEDTRSHKFVANCSDEDGTIASLQWLVNGSKIDNKGNGLTLSRTAYPSQPYVSVRAIDDLGKTAEFNFN